MSVHIYVCMLEREREIKEKALGMEWGDGIGKRRISRLVGWSECMHPKAVELSIIYSLVKIKLIFFYLEILKVHSMVTYAIISMKMTLS